MSYVSALQDTLAAEHAAVHLYALLAARTSRSSEPGLYVLLDGGFAVHRTRRDHLVQVLRVLGEVPVASAPGYVDGLTGDGSRARVLRARRLEEACARAYAWLVESSPSVDRRWAVTALREAAVRQLTLRGAPEMLPGSEGLADR